MQNLHFQLSLTSFYATRSEFLFYYCSCTFWVVQLLFTIIYWYLLLIFIDIYGLFILRKRNAFFSVASLILCFDETILIFYTDLSFSFLKCLSQETSMCLGLCGCKKSLSERFPRRIQACFLKMLFLSVWSCQIEYFNFFNPLPTHPNSRLQKFN